MGYSSEEREAAVSGLVKSDLTFSRDRLGSRRYDLAYDEVKELVDNAFLYEPDAIFYLLSLTSNLLNQAINEEVEKIDELLDDIDDLLKPNQPIHDVSGISDAKNALVSVDGALGRRGTVSATEYARYDAAVQRAVDELKTATRLTYRPRGATQSVTDVVRSSPEAKSRAQAHFNELVDLHAALLQQVEYVLSGYSEFQSEDLPAVVGSKQVSRASSELADLETSMASMTAAERTEVARDTLLTLLANRAVVKGIAAQQAPGTKKLDQPLNGAPTYRVTATGEGTPASVMGSVCAPYKLETAAAQNLGLDANGNTIGPYDLLPSGDTYLGGIEAAEIVGFKNGTFRISGDLAVPHMIATRTIAPGGSFGLAAGANRLHMIVDGQTFDVGLSVAPFDTALQVSIDINGSALGLFVSATAMSSGGVEWVELVYNTGAPGVPAKYGDRHMIVLQGAENANGLGPLRYGSPLVPAPLPNYVESFGWDANNELQIKANDNPSTTTVTLPSGSWPNYSVDAGPDTVAGTVAKAIKDAGGTDFTAEATAADSLITIRSLWKGEGSIVTIISDGLRTSGDPREGFGTPSYNGMNTLGFFENQEDRKQDVDGYVVTNLLNAQPTFVAQAEADLEYTEFLRERRALRFSDTQLAVAVAEDPTGTWTAGGVMKVRVAAGENKGVYGLTSFAWVSGTVVLTLDRRLRDSSSDRFHDVVVYTEYLTVASTDASTTSSIEITDPTDSARSVLGLPSGLVRGTVGQVLVRYNDPRLGWRVLDLRGRKLKAGDELIDVDTGTVQTSVSGTDSAESGLLDVSPEVSPLLDLTATEGFYIQSLAYSQYLAFEEDLSGWKSNDLPPFDEDLGDIEKALTPLIRSDPGSAKVESTYSLVESLKTALTGAGGASEIVASFAVARVQEVDESLEAMDERGLDRARKLLLQGRIADYFATTSANASYSQAFMQAASEVYVEDVNEPSNLVKTQFGSEFERAVEYHVDDIDPLDDFSDLETELDPPDSLDYWDGVE